MAKPATKPSRRYVEYLPLSKLKAATSNPKRHQLEAIGASYDEHGFVEPVVIDERTGRLVAGHGRREQLLARKAAGKAPPDGVEAKGGEWLVPVGRGWASKTDAEAEAYLLSSNRLVELGGWALEELVPMLRRLEPTANMLAIGWTSDDLAAMVAKLEAPQGGPPSPTLKDRFLVPPFSVLDARQGYWQDRKRAWLSIGIESEVGRGTNLLKMSETALEPDPVKRAAKKAQRTADDYESKKRPNGHLDDKAQKALGVIFTSGAAMDRSGGASQTGTSIFDPVICELAYRWFVPAGGRILDPFAGGSVRGVVASKLGYEYTGVDLREEQVAANRAQGAKLCGERPPTWVCGDSQRLGQLVKMDADFVFSCPPYADLERYSDDPRDLSTMEYEAFAKAYRAIIGAAVRQLRNNRFACFVVGDVRDPKGLYRNFVGLTIQAFQDAGAAYYNEAILVTSVGSLPIRAGKIFSASRKLGKTHQNVLVFCKGDPRKAAEACGTVDVSFPDDIPVEGEESQAPGGRLVDLVPGWKKGKANPLHLDNRGPIAREGFELVKVSAKNARLLFNGCDPEYIASTCHSSCCESSTSPVGIVVAIHPNERAAIAARGGIMDTAGLLQPREGERKCPFKSEEHLCELHFTEDKPFGCRASPFTLNENGTLIVRNRYKLLKCYDDGARQPAYKAFRASLDLLFGKPEAERICAHFDAGGGDLMAELPAASAERLRFKNEASNAKNRESKPAAKAAPIIADASGEMQGPPAWAKGYPLEQLRAVAAVFKAHDKPYVLGAFTGVKENTVAQWLFDGELLVLTDGPNGNPVACAVERKARARSSIKDFSGAAIGQVLPGDLVIKRLAGPPELLKEMLEENLALPERAWLEIWQEHKPSRQAAHAAGFEWVGTKIAASSELIGVWARGIAGAQAPSVFEQAALVRLRGLQLDVEPLARALRAKDPAWADHYSTYNKGKTWSALSLCGYGPPDFIIKPSEMSKAWKAENAKLLGAPLGNTTLRKMLPEAEPLIAAIPGVKHRIRLMRLEREQGELTRHADITDPDAGVAPGRLMRIHIPIETNPKVMFTQWLLDGARRERHFPAGQAWYLDTRKPHTAVNKGASARIHLVLDVESSPELLALLEVERG